jgi:hypothetical protein
VRESDLGLCAFDLVLKDFIDKQKEYNKRLSKLDAILSDVEDLKQNLVSEVSEFFDMTKPWATFRCSGT